MDKIFSTRVDEAVIHRISYLARRLRTSKKQVIEKAVEAYAERVEREQKTSVVAQTAGAWRRNESPEQTIAEARATFQRSMDRYKR